MKVHEAIARSLVDNGIHTLFGVIGDGNLFFVNSFAQLPGTHYVAAAGEAGGVLMALGYATASSTVGVATVTHGPALTNTMSALVEGVKGGLPILLVCGDTATIDHENLQNIAQREVVLASGAGFEQARSPATIMEDLASALRRAIIERRPVVLNVPIDFQWQEIDYAPIIVSIADMRAYVPMSADLEAAVGIVAAARRPLIVAGRGAASDEARATLIALGERTGAPLATTLKARDLFRGEPFNIGIMGTLSTPVAVDTILESDCVLAFGASLNKWTSSAGTFLRGKRLIQCNLEPAEIGKYVRPTVGLVGDPINMARIIAHWLDEAEIEPSGFRTEALRERIAGYSAASDFEDLTTDQTIDMRVVLARLNMAVPANRLFVSDGGRFMSQAFKMIEVEGPNAYVFGSNFGSIGFGLPYAIGAARAAPDRPTLLVIGDGGFMLGGLTEFNTAVREGTDLIVVLCNDGGYGAEHIQFRNRDLDPGIALFEWPDFAPVADALGGKGITVRSSRDLDAAVRAIQERNRPLLIDVKCDPCRMPESSKPR
jgi:thiamine pyrophosphate-dependent acetolactate synthase large subunit-like protein